MLYRSVLRPVLFRLPPESAHELALHSLALALWPAWMRSLAAGRLSRAPFGELRRFGLSFENPVGLAAGFDKNGVAAEGLAALGFGFIEVGTVTREAQPGNPRPRLFRLPRDRALINRAGFNNQGAAAVADHLSRHRPHCVLGINIGKSRSVSVEDAIPDYLASFELAHPIADYIVVNVSSPNTPNLRELQRPRELAALLMALQQRNEELSRGHKGQETVPLLVKIAPDLDFSDLEAIVEVALSAGLKGIIATNTTTSRAGLRTPPREVEACGQGGLSGAPLRARSTEIIARLYHLTRGRLSIIGVGGIFNAADAWEKICAGASLVQLYTGFIYEGVYVVRRINDGLAEIAAREGISSLDEAVGCRAAELSIS
ncbi:MAG TPA: quinone-dependent dihydroorotate dehydrogenase [Pyrinomonadaceae bacterium]|jgi:dihydroorotate dehydrogenase